jgi:tellurite resistance protein TerC
VNVPLWAWAAFIVFVLAMLALDLFVLHRGAREVSLGEAGLWSAIWVMLALGFGGLLFLWQGGGTAEAYLAGYLIEKSLSVDNIFVFALIFSMFGVPLRYQHRVLMCGVIGALVMRAAFIAGGAALLEAFHLTIYLFGALLIYTAVRVLRHGGTQIHPDKNPVLRLIRRVIPSTDALHGHKFFTRVDGKWLATPLLAVLILIESTDVLFAIDSIPAIFAVTRDTFIVFTSNIFALLGMRALYFLLAGAAQRFIYLQTGLGIILAGVGVKLLLTDVYHVPTWASLVFILTVLAGTFGLSWRATRRRGPGAAEPGPGAPEAVAPEAGPVTAEPGLGPAPRNHADGSRPVRMRVMARSNRGSS